MPNNVELSDRVPVVEQADIAALLREHRDAIAAFAQHVSAFSEAETQTPRAEGKWTPAQETRHLALTCRVFARAITTGEDIALCVSPERSRELYQRVVPRVLAGGWFPRGGISPEVAVPGDAIPSTPLAIGDLTQANGEFDGAVAAAYASNPTTRTMHPFFGPMLLPELVSFLTAHVNHHRSLLPLPTNRADS